MSTADAEAAKRAEANTLGARIAAMAAAATVTEAHILAHVRDVDARGLWEATGMKSCAHWLAWWLSLDLDTAREKVRVARKLGELSKIAARFEAGGLSYSQTRALARVATPETEDDLLREADRSTAVELEQICRRWGEHVAAVTPPRPGDRRLRSKPLPSGLVRIEALLFPDEAQRVLAAIEVLVQQDRRCAAPPVDPVPDPSAEGSAPQPTLQERRADALVTMADHVLADPERESPAAVRHELTVIVDQTASEGQQRCELVDGTPVTAETVDRLACNASLRRVVVDGKGTPIDVGRKSRAISERMKIALVARDGWCRFPGCTSRARAEGHHIVAWSKGGRTDLDNLSLDCGYHHKLLHEGGYRCERAADGELEHFDPEGRRIPRVPKRVDADLQAIADAVRAGGMRSDAG